MTKNELKEIIKECLVEENSQEDIAEESVEDITEDTNIELTTESVIGSIVGAIILGILVPYIAILVCLIIMAPILIIADRSKTKKVEKIIRENPEVSKAITNFCDKTKDSIIKASGKDKKYFIDSDVDYLHKSNFQFNNDTNRLYAPLLYIDSLTILDDLYNTGYEGYADLCHHDNPDDYPPMKKEIRELLARLKSYVSSTNDAMKHIGNTSKIKLVFDDTPINGYEPFFTGCFDEDEGIVVYLSIEFSDYSNIKVSEKYKATFDKIKAKFNSNKIKID